MREIAKIVTVAVLIALPILMSACNTVAGMGKDTQDTAHGMQHSGDNNGGDDKDK